MGVWTSLFGGTGTGGTDFAVGSPYQMIVNCDEFIKYYVKGIYKRVLIACMNKTSDLDLEIETAMWEQALGDEVQNGYFNLVSKAMYDKTKLYLEYKTDTKVILVVQEKEYKELTKNKAFLDFTGFEQSDLLRLYAGMQYDLLAFLGGSLQLARSIQYKIEGLRELVSADEATKALEQLEKVITGIKVGKSVAIDSKDSLELFGINTSLVKEAQEIINGLISSTLGVSLSYINGAMSSGLSTTGEGDMTMNEDGIKNYWQSIYKPSVDKLFNKTITFKSDNWRKISALSEVLAKVEMLTSVTEEQKQKIVKDLIDG